MAIWMMACGNAGTEGEASALAAASPTAADEGAKVFKQYCVACHGLYGDMGVNGAFNLQTSKLSLEEKVAVITNGRNAMTPFKDVLSPEQIKAVAQYTLTLKK